jgi:hypothetical protein
VSVVKGKETFSILVNYTILEMNTNNIRLPQSSVFKEHMWHTGTNYFSVICDVLHNLCLYNVLIPEMFVAVVTRYKELSFTITGLAEFKILKNWN